MGRVWEDPRVARGMRAQLAERARRLEAGEAPLGWKVAFGAPPAQRQLAIGAPLVGYLTDASQVPPGTTPSIQGWTRPALEPEIAVHMGADLEANADRATAAAAIAGLGPAFELADVDLPLEDPEAILAGNIFHRAVVLGPPDPRRAGGSAEGLSATVACDGETIAETTDPLDLVGGDLVDITRHVTDLLGAFGEKLRAGDVIITGSLVPLVWPVPGHSYRYELHPLDELRIAYAS